MCSQSLLREKRVAGAELGLHCHLVIGEKMASVPKQLY